MYLEAVLPGVMPDELCPGCQGRVPRSDAALSLFGSLDEDAVMDAFARGEIQALSPGQETPHHTALACDFRLLPPSVLYVCGNDRNEACKWLQRFGLIGTDAEVQQCCDREGPFSTSG